MDNLKKKFGQRVRKIRQKQNLSQEELAEKIDIAVNNMGKIERGESFVTAVTLEKLASVLNVKVEDFFKFDTHNPNNLLKIGRSLKLVDEISITPCEKPNDIFAFLRAFIQEGRDTDTKKAVFKKCILASEKSQLPMESAHKYLPSHMEEIFENAGVNDTFENFYTRMNEFRGQKNHMELVQKYLENI